MSILKNVLSHLSVAAQVSYDQRGWISVGSEWRSEGLVLRHTLDSKGFLSLFVEAPQSGTIRPSTLTLGCFADFVVPEKAKYGLMFGLNF
jgi:hypothetical protein